MKRRTPICLLLRPSATSPATSSSRLASGLARETFGTRHVDRSGFAKREPQRRLATHVLTRGECGIEGRGSQRFLRHVLRSRGNWNRRSPERRACLRAQHVCRSEQLCGYSCAADVRRIPARGRKAPILAEPVVDLTSDLQCLDEPRVGRMKIAGHHSRHTEIAEHVFELVEITRLTAQG